MRSPRYHALFVHEDTPHYVTSVTHGRAEIFRDEVCARKLLEELHFYADRFKVELIAAVVMPDHFHAIIWPQTKEKTFSDYMHGVKSYFARWYADESARRGAVAPPIIQGSSSDQRSSVNEPSYRRGDSAPPSRDIKKIWQDSFFDYLILNERKLEEKILYIMENPVEDGLAARPRDYPYLYVNPDYRVD